MPGITLSVAFFIYCISVLLFSRKLFIYFITRPGGNCDALQLEAARRRASRSLRLVLCMSSNLINVGISSAKHYCSKTIRSLCTTHANLCEVDNAPAYKFSNCVTIGPHLSVFLPRHILRMRRNCYFITWDIAIRLSDPDFIKENHHLAITRRFQMLFALCRKICHISVSVPCDLMTLLSYVPLRTRTIFTKLHCV